MSWRDPWLRGGDVPDSSGDHPMLPSTLLPILPPDSRELVPVNYPELQLTDTIPSLNLGGFDERAMDLPVPNTRDRYLPTNQARRIVNGMRRVVDGMGTRMEELQHWGNCQKNVQERLVKELRDMFLQFENNFGIFHKMCQC